MPYPGRTGNSQDGNAAQCFLSTRAVQVTPKAAHDQSLSQTTEIATLNSEVRIRSKTLSPLGVADMDQTRLWRGPIRMARRGKAQTDGSGD